MRIEREAPRFLRKPRERYQRGLEGSTGKEESEIPIPSWFPFWKDRAWSRYFYVEGVRHRRSHGACHLEEVEVEIEVAKGMYDAAWEWALSPSPAVAEVANVHIARRGKHVRELKRIVDDFGVSKCVDEHDEFNKEWCCVALTRPKMESGHGAPGHHGSAQRGRPFRSQAKIRVSRRREAQPKPHPETARPAARDCDGSVGRSYGYGPAPAEYDRRPAPRDEAGPPARPLTSQRHRASDPSHEAKRPSGPMPAHGHARQCPPHGSLQLRPQDPPDPRPPQVSRADTRTPLVRAFAAQSRRLPHQGAFMCNRHGKIC